MRYKLVLKNANGAIEFSQNSRVIIEGIGGFTKQTVSFSTTKSNREIGEKIEAKSVKRKTLPIYGTIMGASDVVRAQMLHVIAPLVESKLIFNDEYEMTVYAQETPDVERYEQNAKFSFSLFIPFPFWRRKNKTTNTLSGLRGLFSFPWNISEPNPFAFSDLVEVGYVTVRNDGEASACWTVTFYALDEVTNPRIYNMDTGEYVKILKTMETGEQITISTEGDELTVVCKGADGVETDGFPYLDIESEPFELAVGENHIKTDAEANTAALRASISFRPAFVGV